MDHTPSRPRRCSPALPGCGPQGTSSRRRAPSCGCFAPRRRRPGLPCLRRWAGCRTPWLPEPAVPVRMAGTRGKS
eukprot:3360661-Alexandrium_andersonii.AAC.1